MNYKDERDHRFHDWNGSIGYYTPESCLHSDTYITDSRKNLNDTKPFLNSSLKIASQLYSSNKNPISVKSPTNLSISHSKRKLVTNTSKSYINTRTWKEILLDKNDESLWKTYFNRYQKKMTKPATSFDFSVFEDVFISVFDVAGVVHDCLGEDVPSFVVDKFFKLAFNICKDKAISWSDFKTIISKVAKLYELEIERKADPSVLLNLMRKTHLADRATGPLDEPTTVYKDTMCTSDFDSQKVLETCRSRPEITLDIDLNPTASILYAGTIKSTKQIPGYRGHIPTNIKSDRKNEHSFGKTLHPTKNDLILTQKHSTLGYTGHCPPHGSKSDVRMTGCDPRTTNGATYGRNRQML